MEAQIISKQIIKPSSSTPQRLRTYTLSLLYQLVPPIYVPMIFFYSATSENSSIKSHHLKTSLSKTLTHFYHLAGRIKDSFSIDCNDEGALYIEAHVDGDMSMILQEPDIHMLEKLLPCNTHEVSSDISSQVILAIQVTDFDCGGIAVTVCIKHAVADSSAVGSFLSSWAAVARGTNGDIDGVIFDRPSLFPPQDVESLALHNMVNVEALSKSSTKRFLFHSSKIAVLREEVGNGPCLDRPTRVEALAALIWGALLTATEEAYELVIPIDLRRRMDPPLPKKSLGNMSQCVIVDSENVLGLDYNGLAGKIHESIRTMNNEYLRKLHADGG